MKLAWAGNYPLQPTGSARVTREIPPRIDQQSSHDVAQFAVSGIGNAMPTVLNGLTLCGPSSRGGNLEGVDFPLVDQMENLGFWLLYFKAWNTQAFLKPEGGYVKLHLQWNSLMNGTECSNFREVVSCEGLPLSNNPKCVHRGDDLV